MVFRQLSFDWVAVMKKRYQKNYKIIKLPMLVESCREWAERIIGRSPLLSEYRKGDRRKHEKE